MQSCQRRMSIARTLGLTTFHRFGEFNDRAAPASLRRGALTRSQARPGEARPRHARRQLRRRQRLPRPRLVDHRARRLLLADLGDRRLGDRAGPQRLGGVRTSADHRGGHRPRAASRASLGLSACADDGGATAAGRGRGPGRGAVRRPRARRCPIDRPCGGRRPYPASPPSVDPDFVDEVVDQGVQVGVDLSACGVGVVPVDDLSRALFEGDRCAVVGYDGA